MPDILYSNAESSSDFFRSAEKIIKDDQPVALVVPCSVEATKLFYDVVHTRGHEGHALPQYKELIVQDVSKGLRDLNLKEPALMMILRQWAFSSDTSEALEGRPGVEPHFKYDVALKEAFDLIRVIPFPVAYKDSSGVMRPCPQTIEDEAQVVVEGDQKTIKKELVALMKDFHLVCATIKTVQDFIAAGEKDENSEEANRLCSQLLKEVKQLIKNGLLPEVEYEDEQVILSDLVAKRTALERASITKRQALVGRHVWPQKTAREIARSSQFSQVMVYDSMDVEVVPQEGHASSGFTVRSELERLLAGHQMRFDGAHPHQEEEEESDVLVTEFVSTRIAQQRVHPQSVPGVRYESEKDGHEIIQTVQEELNANAPVTVVVPCTDEEAAAYYASRSAGQEYDVSLPYGHAVKDRFVEALSKKGVKNSALGNILDAWSDIEDKREITRSVMLDEARYYADCLSSARCMLLEQEKTADKPSKERLAFFESPPAFFNTLQRLIYEKEHAGVAFSDSHTLWQGLVRNFLSPDDIRAVEWLYQKKVTHDERRKEEARKKGAPSPMKDTDEYQTRLYLAREYLLSKDNPPEALKGTLSHQRRFLEALVSSLHPERPFTFSSDKARWDFVKSELLEEGQVEDIERLNQRELASNFHIVPLPVVYRDDEGRMRACPTQRDGVDSLSEQAHSAFSRVKKAQDKIQALGECSQVVVSSQFTSVYEEQPAFKATSPTVSISGSEDELSGEPFSPLDVSTSDWFNNAERDTEYSDDGLRGEIFSQADVVNDWPDTTGDKDDNFRQTMDNFRQTMIDVFDGVGDMAEDEDDDTFDNFLKLHKAALAKKMRDKDEPKSIGSTDDEMTFGGNLPVMDRSFASDEVTYDALNQGVGLLDGSGNEEIPSSVKEIISSYWNALKSMVPTSVPSFEEAQLAATAQRVEQEKPPSSTFDQVSLEELESESKDAVDRLLSLGYMGPSEEINEEAAGDLDTTGFQRGMHDVLRMMLEEPSTDEEGSGDSTRESRLLIANLHMLGTNPLDRTEASRVTAIHQRKEPAAPVLLIHTGADGRLYCVFKLPEAYKEKTGFPSEGIHHRQMMNATNEGFQYYCVDPKQLKVSPQVLFQGLQSRFPDTVIVFLASPWASARAQSKPRQKKEALLIGPAHESSRGGPACSAAVDVPHPPVHDFFSGWKEAFFSVLNELQEWFKKQCNAMRQTTPPKSTSNQETPVLACSSKSYVESLPEHMKPKLPGIYSKKGKVSSSGAAPQRARAHLPPKRELSKISARPTTKISGQRGKNRSKTTAGASSTGSTLQSSTANSYVDLLKANGIPVGDYPKTTASSSYRTAALASTSRGSKKKLKSSRASDGDLEHAGSL